MDLMQRLSQTPVPSPLAFSYGVLAERTPTNPSKTNYLSVELASETCLQVSTGADLLCHAVLGIKDAMGLLLMSPIKKKN